MSIFALTPSIIRTLQQDFRSGQWGPGTQQFFQQLFDRLGGASAPTITEINNIFVGAGVAAVFLDPRLEVVGSVGFAELIAAPSPSGTPANVAPMGTCPDVGGNVSPWP